jgi:hypothetical protein
MHALLITLVCIIHILATRLLINIFTHTLSDELS